MLNGFCWLSRLVYYSGRLLSILVCVVLLLLPSLSYAQSSPPISKLGPSDYQNFQADWLTVKLQLIDSRKALEKALAEKQIIEQNLADAQQKYDDLVASGIQHSEDSTTLYELVLEEVKRLRRQLQESKALVAELRRSLESAQTEYDQKLKLAEKEIRRQKIEKWVFAILAGAAAGYAGYRIGKALR